MPEQCFVRIWEYEVSQAADRIVARNIISDGLTKRIRRGRNLKRQPLTTRPFQTYKFLQPLIETMLWESPCQAQTACYDDTGRAGRGGASHT